MFQKQNTKLFFQLIIEEGEVAPQGEVDHMAVDIEVIEAAATEAIEMIGITEVIGNIGVIETIETIETIEMIESIIEALRKDSMIEEITESNNRMKLYYERERRTAAGLISID